MVIGYLVRAGVGIAEWLFRSGHRPLARSFGGVTQVVLVFLASLSLLVGLVVEIEPLIILNAPLEVAGLAIFLVRLWPELRHGSWRIDTGCSSGSACWVDRGGDTNRGPTHRIEAVALVDWLDEYLAEANRLHE